MKSLFTFAFLSLYFFGQAQDWKVLHLFNSGEGINDMYSDEKSDLLYVGGSFDSLNGKNMGDIAAWNGQNWIEMDKGINYDTINRRGGSVSHISKYKDKIVVSGHYFDHVGYYKKSKSVAFWHSDSLKWETCNWNPDLSVNFVYETGDTTYVLGTYDSINGKYSPGANYLHNGKWTNMSPPKGVEIPEVLCRYQESLYLGGNMNGSIPGVNDLARWDGGKFYPVSTGVSGGIAMVHDLVVFKNELVVAGNFNKIGHAGQNIMTWDGKQFHNIGNTNQTVTSLKVHNGILYASGGFTEIGGIKANQVAWYDGIKWHKMGSDYHSSFRTLEVYKDKLYGFRNYNGKREFIQYKGRLPTAVSEIQSEHQIKIYPNPVSEILKIEGIQEQEEIKIYTSIGKLIFDRMGAEEVDVSNWQSGMYFLNIKSNNKLETFKIIVP